MKVTIKTHAAHVAPDTMGSVVFDSQKITVTETESVPTPGGDRTVVRIVAPLTAEGIPWLIRHCDVCQTWLVVKWGRKAETLVYRRYQYINQEQYAIELLR